MNNRLLLGSLLALLAYWTTGYLTPAPWLSSFASLGLLVFSAFSAWRYGMPAFEIVVLGRRSGEEGAEGSHLAIYGTALIALGSFYIGTFGLLWVYFDQPAHWLGTPASGFGRALAAAGFLMLYSSPDVTRTGIRLPNVIMLTVIALAAMLLAFFLGTQVRDDEAGSAEHIRFMQRHGDDRPMCSPAKPIWVSSHGHAYHTPDSPYRALVVPVRCYPSEAAAQAAGYAAAN